MIDQIKTSGEPKAIDTKIIEAARSIFNGLTDSFAMPDQNLIIKTVKEMIQNYRAEKVKELELQAKDIYSNIEDLAR